VIILSPSKQNNPLNWSKNSLYNSHTAFRQNTESPWQLINKLLLWILKYEWNFAVCNGYWPCVDSTFVVKEIRVIWRSASPYPINSNSVFKCRKQAQRTWRRNYQLPQLNTNVSPLHPASILTTYILEFLTIAILLSSSRNSEYLFSKRGFPPKFHLKLQRISRTSKPEKAGVQIFNQSQVPLTVQDAGMWAGSWP
jgi:hypothetical protein